MSPHSLSRLALTALITAAFAAASGSTATAQQGDAATPVEDWRLPFRSPQANLVPPEDMFEHLRVMADIARRAPEAKRSIGEDGEEVIDDDAWKEARRKLGEVRFDSGYLSLVIRDSQHVAHRELAFYGAFYCPQPQYAVQLVEHIPGEPIRALRATAMQRALPYLAEWLPKTNEGDLAEWRNQRIGPAGERGPKPGDPQVRLDPVPFLALAAVDDAMDQRQGLWFLARCAELHQPFGMQTLDRGIRLLRILAKSEEPEVRFAVTDFVAAMDPNPERVAERGPDAEAPLDVEATQDWLEAVYYELFPPLRRISAGLYDLYPHPDREQLAQVAKAGIQAGTLFTKKGGKRSDNSAYYGLRILELPEPLDRLGLQVGATLTSINGVPLTSADTLLRHVERSARRGASFLVEYVDTAGTGRAIEFRMR